MSKTARGSMKYENAEHYADPTAGKAIELTQEKKQLPMQLTETIRLMKDIAELGGFEVKSRIWLRDKQTGEVYK